MSKELTNQIKQIRWEHRVTRTGHIQSKIIVAEAEMQPITLTRDIVVRYTNQLWVNDINLYDEKETESFCELFECAFKAEPNWPIHIVKDFESLTLKKALFENKVSGFDGEDNLIDIFNEYCSLLHSIQKYYVIAVPLTNYCENTLKLNNVDPTPFAVAFKKLDVDDHLDSLRSIQKADLGDKECLIEEHLQKFAWIKTAYNIVEPYTRKDVDEELFRRLHEPQIRVGLPKKFESLTKGLQIGIYTRNRIKELSQQIWFAFEPVAQRLAKQLNISREDFFTLTPLEVKATFVNKVLVSAKDMKTRRRAYVAGTVKSQFIFLTGQEASALLEYFSPKGVEIEEFRGQIACKGFVSGIVRVVLNKNDFGKFNQGEVLVTSMTTPDFVILMKKASAIVTNEGGLSSHAAIVSRELGVPCVIGTKIATKALKDGDHIEVDANKGIVKILKKSKERK